MVEICRANARIYATDCAVNIRDFIAIFHSWIQQDALDELLIDVADYTHVPGGPGVLLVAHECYLGFDLSDGRPGLSYRARGRTPAPAGSSWWHAVSRLLVAASMVEEHFGDALRFDGSEMLVGCDDRLRAPHGEESYAALSPELRALASAIYPDASCDIEPLGEPRQCFRARLTIAGARTLGEIALGEISP
jgi:hypothetical protein